MGFCVPPVFLGDSQHVRHQGMERAAGANGAGKVRVTKPRKLLHEGWFGAAQLLGRAGVRVDALGSADPKQSPRGRCLGCGAGAWVRLQT